MFPMPPLNAIGIAASDMAESIRFYRALGLDIPETPDEGHVEAVMPDGARLMLDSEEIILSFLPEWKRVDGNQVSLAFECESPAEVDEIYARVTEAGFEGEKEPGTRSGASATPCSGTPTAFGSTSTPLWNSVTANGCSSGATDELRVLTRRPRPGRGRHAGLGAGGRARARTPGRFSYTDMDGEQPTRTRLLAHTVSGGGGSVSKVLLYHGDEQGPSLS